MDAMIAYCGLDCRGCSIHLATLEPDESKQQEMRATIALLCSEHYGLNLLSEDVSNCDGCRSDTGRLFSGCAHCEIRSCAIKRKLESCAFCDEYACDKLRSHFETDPTAEARLQVLRDQM